ncbi:hypothetical protein J6590_040207 [Homalodisca vitripennis]|nr:hypothetical protein J6590_040207 [Homalodisca vitripennis]
MKERDWSSCILIYGSHDEYGIVPKSTRVWNPSSFSEQIDGGDWSVVYSRPVFVTYPVFIALHAIVRLVLVSACGTASCLLPASWAKVILDHMSVLPTPHPPHPVRDVCRHLVYCDTSR